MPSTPPATTLACSAADRRRARSILLVDDDVDTLFRLASCLERRGHTVTLARSLVEGRAELQAESFDVLALDVALPDGSGLELLPSIETDRTRVILITGQPPMVEAMLSIHHRDLMFMPKPIDVDELSQLASEAPGAASASSEALASATGELIGADHTMVRLRQQLGAAAQREESLVIEGESGSGRDEAIEFYRSIRGSMPIRGSADAMPSSQAESELSVRCIRDVTELGPDEQRQLAERIRFDDRDSWIVTVHVSLDEAIATRRLVPELLEVLPERKLAIPPLRRRRGDIPLLVDHFCSLAPGAPRIATPAIERMMRADWPGNVRQLRVEVLRAIRRADGALVTEDCLSRWLVDRSPATIQIPVDCTVAGAERKLIAACLAAHGGDRRAAAVSLGISLRTLYNRLNEYAAHAKRDPASG